jgi:hypothetical protein
MSKQLFIAIGASLVAFVLGFATTSTTWANQKTTQNANQDRKLLKRTFDRWEYEVFEIGSQAYIHISSSVVGKSAVKELLQQQKGEAKNLLKSDQQIPIVVLTSDPLQPADLVQFARDYGLAIQSYKLLARDSEDKLVTIFGVPINGNIMPEDMLKAVISNVEQNENTKLTVLGVVSIDSRVNSVALGRLAKDVRVLGVDLSPAIALQDLAQQLPNVDTATVEIVSAPLYWEAAR